MTIRWLKLVEIPLRGVMKISKEIREVTTKVELRDGGEDKPDFIEGYALKFDKWSKRMGFFLPFQEIISRDALNGTNVEDVVALFNHDQSYPLARNTLDSGAGSLKLERDNIGLRFSFVPTDTTYAQDLKENIRSGVINKCSFAFSINPDDMDAEEIEYNEEADVFERTIKKIDRLFDVSLVTTPAYDDTEAVVGERSVDKMKELKEERSKPDLETEKLKLEIQDIDLIL